MEHKVFHFWGVAFKKHLWNQGWQIKMALKCVENNSCILHHCKTKLIPLDNAHFAKNDQMCVSVPLCMCVSVPEMGLM